MVTAFRFGGVTQPTDKGSSMAYDPKTGFHFPVSVKNADGTMKASAGPFVFKASISKESTFTWTPLSAELSVGASFALKISSELSTNTAGVGITWKPALPGADASLLLGLGAALLGVLAAITGFTGQLGANKDSGKIPTDISAYLALVATALGLLAIQKNMTMKMVLPLTLDLTLHPLLTVSKEEGEETSFTPLESKTALYEWSNNTSKTFAALGVVRASASQTDTNAGDVGANAVQVRAAGNSNVV